MPKKPKTPDNHIPWYVWLFLGFGIILVSVAIGIIWAISDELSVFARLGSDVANIAAGVGVAIAGGGFLAWRSILFQEQIQQVKSSNENQTWKDSVELIANEKSASARVGGVETLYKDTMNKLKYNRYEDAEIVLKILGQHLKDISNNYSEKTNPKKLRDAPYEILHCIKRIEEIIREINKKNPKKEEQKLSFNIYECDLSDLIIRPYSIIKNLRNNLFLERLNFVSSQFSGARMLITDFKHTGFYICNFIGSSFRYPRFEDVEIMKSDLTDSSFQKSKFTKTRFDSSNLTRAKFKGLSAMNYNDTSKQILFKNCNLTNTEFDVTIGLTKYNFEGCYYYRPLGDIENGRPTLPKGIPKDVVESRIRLPKSKIRLPT